ncbi:polysaccharide deacetylase family protein [Singulisphaera sp. Ch08]|uniref:Polysaccharide deacetylase family protein n=1 Tax=Singulisphaera sp. Ch08 TaxID=3120278 RepID=A0AAU7C667_9BACT
MISSIQSLVRMTDCLIARAYLSLFRERNALISFLFHSLFRDEREIAQNLVDPLQRTTVAQFRRFVEYFLEHDYQFIGPNEVLAGLDPQKRYALITFDDGYFNNTLALDVLEEYKVPALFFVSTEHVRQNKCFWWDVLYRERIAQGAPARKVYGEGIALKSKTSEQIESELSARFGPEAFVPRGSIDRPFTPDELRDFASRPYVHLGNHTANHAILTNYSPDQVRSQIAGAQNSLKEMTGDSPNSIAYPNGAHSQGIMETCGEFGLKIGFTVKPKKNLFPLDVHSIDALRLGRFAPHGDSTIETQCRTYRSDLLLYGALRAGYLKFHRGVTGT